MLKRNWNPTGLAVLSGALLICGAASLGQPAVGLAGQRSSGAEDERLVGRRIYRAECLQCHGEHGRGDGRAACDFEVRPADLTDPDLADETDEALLRKVMHARKPMPNYESSFSGGERRAIAAYLRELATPKHPAPATPAAAAQQGAQSQGSKGRGA